MTFPLLALLAMSVPKPIAQSFPLRDVRLLGGAFEAAHIATAPSSSQHTWTTGGRRGTRSTGLPFWWRRGAFWPGGSSRFRAGR